MIRFPTVMKPEVDFSKLSLKFMPDRSLFPNEADFDLTVSLVNLQKGDSNILSYCRTTCLRVIPEEELRINLGTSTTQFAYHLDDLVARGIVRKCHNNNRSSSVFLSERRRSHLDLLTQLKLIPPAKQLPTVEKAGLLLSGAKNHGFYNRMDIGYMVSNVRVASHLYENSTKSIQTTKEWIEKGGSSMYELVELLNQIGTTESAQLSDELLEESIMLEENLEQ